MIDLDLLAVRIRRRLQYSSYELTPKAILEWAVAADNSVQRAFRVKDIGTVGDRIDILYLVPDRYMLPVMHLRHRAYTVSAASISPELSSTDCAQRLALLQRMFEDPDA